MKTLLIFLAGAVVGVLGTWLWRRGAGRRNTTIPQSPPWKGGEEKKPLDNTWGKETLILRQKREKEAHKASMLELLKTTTPLTNDHIEQMLGVSDATATRYLEDLEKEGKVRQVGKTGAGVHYERIDA